MKFKEEVQEYFRKAGWFEGRSVKEKFDAIPRFDEFPDFLKDFLYEYGDLEVEIHKLTEDEVTAILNLKALPDGYFRIDGYFEKNRGYGHDLRTFPIAYYALDNAALECDADGTVYLASDFPIRLADNFKEGIERMIMMDYKGVSTWEEFENDWG